MNAWLIFGEMLIVAVIGVLVIVYCSDPFICDENYADEWSAAAVDWGCEPCEHDWACTGDVFNGPQPPEFTCKKCGQICPAGTPIKKENM